MITAASATATGRQRVVNDVIVLIPFNVISIGGGGGFV